MEAVADEAPTFDAFYRATYAWALRLAHVLTGDQAAAEDVVQDAYASVHRHYATLANPGAVLRTAVVNNSRTLFRKRGREQARLRLLRPADSVGMPARELLDAIDRLPHRQKAVLVLRYYEDLSEREIAEVLGCRTGTVKSLASRALERLSKEIER